MPALTADPATKAVAVPIYQTAAYVFDSADHAAALFNLEEEGFRYSRISNPTVAVLEKRVAELEGGVAALATASGQAALHYAFSNVADRHGGGNIVSTPQLYGTTHTLLAHVLPRSGITGRFAADDSAEAMAACDRRKHPRAVLRDAWAIPPAISATSKPSPRVAHAHGVPLIVDNTVATPILLRPIDHGADIVVHSLTKFMGGHGSAMGGILVDGGNFDWMAHAARFPQFTTPDESYHGLVYAERFGRAAFAGARPQRLSAHHRRHSVADERLPAAAGHRDRGAARRAPCRECAAPWRNSCTPMPAVEWVQYAGFADSPYHALAQKYLGGKVPSLLTFGVKGGFEAGKRFL